MTEHEKKFPSQQRENLLHLLYSTLEYRSPTWYFHEDIENTLKTTHPNLIDRDFATAATYLEYLLCSAASNQIQFNTDIHPHFVDLSDHQFEQLCQRISHFIDKTIEGENQSATEQGPRLAPSFTQETPAPAPKPQRPQERELELELELEPDKKALECLAELLMSFGSLFAALIFTDSPKSAPTPSPMPPSARRRRKRR